MPADIHRLHPQMNLEGWHCPCGGDTVLQAPRHMPVISAKPVLHLQTLPAREKAS